MHIRTHYWGHTVTVDRTTDHGREFFGLSIAYDEYDYLVRLASLPLNTLWTYTSVQDKRTNIAQ